MFSNETADHPLDDPKKACRDQCFNLVIDQAIQSIKQSSGLQTTARGPNPSREDISPGQPRHVVNNKK